MITIDQSKCNLCGWCVEICHEYCIDIHDNVLKINYDYCSTCTQCIAVCPKEALSWENIQPGRYNREMTPDSQQIDELLKERRTIRDFKEKKIDRNLLEEIVNYAVYAPTHSFDMRAIIIDREEAIQEIDRMIYSSSLKIYKYLYKPRIAYPFIRSIAPGRKHEYLKAKPKLEAARKRGRNFKTIPPAIIMIVADRRVPLSLESAQYALYSINLYAHTKDLGCRNMVGNQMFLNRNRSIRKLIGLKKYERIYGTMAIGYPAIKFRSKVEGKQFKMQWIS